MSGYGDFSLNSRVQENYNVVPKATADTTNTPIKKMQQPQSIVTEAAQKRAENNKQPVQANIADTRYIPKAPKPPTVKEEDLSANATNSTNDAGVTVGSFKTNLPTFNGLNMENVTAIDTAGGVGIYGNEKVDAKTEPGPPEMQVLTFNNGTVEVKFPTPTETPVKGSVVFDEKTKTYAFNNIEGLEISNAYVTSSPNEKSAQRYGGENFLINGGTVNKIDTAERVTSGKNAEALSFNLKSQNVVLMNTKVKDGAISLANDHVLAINGTEIDTSKINVIAQNNGTSNEGSSFFAQEGDVSNSTRELQTGISVRAALTNWLNGSDKDMKSLKVSDFKATVKVDESSPFAAINMENAPISRTAENLHIYTANNDPESVKIFPNDDGTNSIYLRTNKNEGGGNHIVFKLPQTQPDGAKLFFDEATGTVYVENLDHVTYNPTGNKKYDKTKVNLFIKDCNFDYLNTAETREQWSGSNTATIANRETGNKYQSNIAITGNSKIGTMRATYDNIYMDDNATIEDFAGLGNNAPDKLKAQNHISEKGSLGNKILYARKDNAPDDVKHLFGGIYTD